MPVASVYFSETNFAIIEPYFCISFTFSPSPFTATGVFVEGVANENTSEVAVLLCVNCHHGLDMILWLVN